MQRVSIIGLGLMGGSIGLALRRWSSQNAKGGNDALEITGFDTDLEQQSYAKKINAVEKTEWNLVNAVKYADIIIIATPVLAAREIFVDIAPHLKSGAVVTDVSST
jgi:prephenate dehydrogenase